jgi:bisphosphoglycerate-independent phosphoglycerate mutase (AlkP superfamily)
MDFVCLNYANPDMVGHTGVFQAIVKAVEVTDRCAERVWKPGGPAGIRSSSSPITAMRTRP